jgi:hypothetical protein
MTAVAQRILKKLVKDEYLLILKRSAALIDFSNKPGTGICPVAFGCSF